MARTAFFSGILDPATGLDYDLNLSHDYKDFSRLKDGKWLKQSSKNLPKVILPYSYVWWPKDGAGDNLELRGIILIEVELYFGNQKYVPLRKKME
jgi:hypothetical protein